MLGNRCPRPRCASLTRSSGLPNPSGTGRRTRRRRHRQRYLQPPSPSLFPSDCSFPWRLVRDDGPLFSFPPCFLRAVRAARSESLFLREPLIDEVLTDPVCYECGSPLTIVDRDASFLAVVCAECGNSHGIEVTTADDGTPVYWPCFRISLKGEVST